LIFLIKSAVFTSAGAKIWTVSVAKLTLALTPLMELSEFSMEFTQEEQVIPEAENVLVTSADLLRSAAI
jgi:hypothetical protein